MEVYEKMLIILSILSWFKGQQGQIEDLIQVQQPGM